MLRTQSYTFIFSLLALAFGILFFGIAPERASAQVNPTELQNRIVELQNRLNTMRATTTRQQSGREGMATTTRPVRDLSCMSAAVSTREDAIVTMWGEFNSAVSEALADRKEGLIGAWAITNVAERNKALAEVWKTWKTDRQAAHTELRRDRKAAWDVFKVAAKACRATLPKEEQGVERAASDTIAL